MDLARKPKKKLRNMKVSVTSVVIGTLGPVTKGFLKGLKE